MRISDWSSDVCSSDLTITHHNNNKTSLFSFLLLSSLPVVERNEEELWTGWMWSMHSIDILHGWRLCNTKDSVCKFVFEASHFLQKIGSASFSDTVCQKV